MICRFAFDVIINGWLSRRLLKKSMLINDAKAIFPLPRPYPHRPPKCRTRHKTRDTSGNVSRGLVLESHSG